MAEIESADATPEPATPAAARPLLTAELLSVGTEITAGETRDTNAGELARALTERGVTVARMQAVPDELEVVVDAFARASERADLVVSTGGLGPTPDDLTREAIAEVVGEEPAVDPALERWLRGLWARRGMPFPELNLKQAWRIPSATPIPNDNGTAPGWWVDRPDGGVILALPGPPREMRPMWTAWAVPRLSARGLGREIEVRTFRLAGIGESQVADLLGSKLLRARNPVVATYARADAVDVRISATAENGRSARELADDAEAIVVERLGTNVWARGATTWSEAIARELKQRGWTLATTEAATGGALAALLAGLPALRHAEVRLEAFEGEPGAVAEAARQSANADVAVALTLAPDGQDTTVRLAIATPEGAVEEQRTVFLGGEQGRHRAALTAADILLGRLRGTAPRAGATSRSETRR